MCTAKTVVTGGKLNDLNFAVRFVTRASDCLSSVWIEVQEKRISAKSLLGFLSLVPENRHEIMLIADGVDEKNSLAVLIDLLENYN